MNFRDFSVSLDESKNACFQVIDWYHFDYSNENNQSKYMIKMFGVTEKGHSICANVTDFQPHFYVSSKVKPKFSQTEIDELEEYLVRKLPHNFKESITVSQVKRKSIWGFTNGTYQQYIKLSFENIISMYITRKMFQYKIKILSSHIKFDLNESNIDPFLRFIHTQNIKPGGWISIDEYTTDVDDELVSTCQINLTASCDNVQPFDCNKVAPVNILSFDIECTSATGDFPVPIKTYKKTAEEVSDLYNSFKSETNHDGFTPALYKCMMLMFDENFKDSTGNYCNKDIYNANTNNIKFSKLYPKKKVKDLQAIFQKIQGYSDTIIDILKKRSNEVIFQQENDDLEPTVVNQLEVLLNSFLPTLKGDSIIQIGSTLHQYGSTKCSYKNVITLDTCDDIEGVDVITCKTETALIKEWCKLIHRVDPDIMTGYNIFGFDFDYIYKRSLELGCEKYVLSCSRLEGHTSKFKEKMLTSSALGENLLKYVEMEGRVFIDLMKVVQRQYNLDSYKLDNVASHFMSGKVKRHENKTLVLDASAGINVGDYVKLNNTYKCMVMSVDNNTIGIDTYIDEKITTWGLAKDDVSPKEIFACQKGTSADRAKIAKYCVQDCALCNMLIIKLEVFANNMGMANVCLVPLSYIFMRGQGIKIFSLVAKQCRDDKFMIPLIKFEEDSEEQEGYEGAIVLDPIPGIYVEAPVSVMDYASLYPSSMISENISHDSIVIDKKYDNLPGIEYVDVTYDIFSGVGDKKIKEGEKTCRYAQFKNNEKGILPRILMKLLSQRKATRKQILHKTITTHDNRCFTGLVDENANGITIKTTDNKTIQLNIDEVMSSVDAYDDFTKAVLDGLQLAYKITANSLYGQVGSRTSPIYMKELAASTTATGRNLIMKAKEFMETNYDADVVYGDTDSIFVDFKIKEKYGLSDKEALQKSIDISVDASNKFKKELKAPHDLEYEKTFFPFIILSKKKYVGNLYEHDVNTYKQKSMGIVLKRRDNANIVKIVYGGIIDILLNKQNISFAIDFLKESLNKLIKGEFHMDDLVITKTLRTTYKDPTRIAHKVLADRMRSRDPGSAPQSSDRVPYAYVEHDVKNKRLLQGDKIEHPTYIKENNVKLDYTFYISNQLMKPICQLMALALFQIPKASKPEIYSRKLKQLTMDFQGNVKKATEKVSDLKQKEIRKLLFDETLVQLNNKRMGNREITEFFKMTVESETP
jgi:DNA polymerase elongation subunit (family B)